MSARHRAAMWQNYVLRGCSVTVVQHWHDPFGRAMVGVAPADTEAPVEGLPEAVFLAEATPLPPPRRHA